MTTHLPECKTLDEWEVFDDTDGHKSIRQKCICDILRACEQRVRERCALEIDHGPQMGNGLEWLLNPIRKYHYERALKAVRDAIELRMRVSVYELSDEHKAYNKGIRTALTVVSDLRDTP